jgi:hypothetical protein
MKRFFSLLILGVILVTPIFGQLNFSEISETELENKEYTIIYEDSNEDYYLVDIDGATYIFYY